MGLPIKSEHILEHAEHIERLSLLIQPPRGKVIPENNTTGKRVLVVELDLQKNWSLWNYPERAKNIEVQQNQN